MDNVNTICSHSESDGKVINPQYRRFLARINLTKTSSASYYDQMTRITLDELDYIKVIFMSRSVGKRHDEL